MCKIESAEAVSVGTTAKEVETHFRGFLLANASADKTIYFCNGEKKATAAAAFPIPAGTTLDIRFTADKISVIASGAGADLRILYIDD